MPAPVVLALLATLATAPDTTPAVRADTGAGPTIAMAASGMLLPQDTVPRRRHKAVEVSDAYEVRLRIHRIGSYLVYPLFISQAVAGNQIYKDSKAAPDWAKTTHRVGATALAGVFTL